MAYLPADQLEAFGVFRRAEQHTDKAPDSRSGDQTRLIASKPDVRACGPSALDPKQPLGHFTNNGRGGRLVLAFPDGARAPVYTARRS